MNLTYNCSNRYCHCNVAEKCVSVCEWLKIEPRWISVKDRLPEYDSHFLGYTFDGNMIVGFYWAVEWDRAFGFITHWMELPDAPYAAAPPAKE